MSGHLDGPPPGPPDPPYIPGDLGAPSAEEFARRRGVNDAQIILDCLKFARDETAGYWGKEQEAVYQRFLGENGAGTP